MFQHPLRQSWLFLITIFATTCGLPEAVTPPTAVPATPIMIAAAPRLAVLTAGPSATLVLPTVPASVIPQDQLDPTQEAYCQQPSSSVMPECVAQKVELPTPLSIPFAQALQQFTNHALLYVNWPGLLLGDPDSGNSLWISGAFCPPRSTRDIYGAWSTDGQFIAFTCQDVHYNVTIHLLDMQTADERQIAAGDAAEFAWSPAGHRLLVTYQTTDQRAFVLDAATSAMTALPDAPLWENNGGYPMNVGRAIPNGGWFINANYAAMAWSPDGMRIAVIGGNGLSVLDADSTYAHDGKLAVLTSVGGGPIRRPQWSHDGRFLYTVAPHQNHNNPLSPSSEFGAIALRTEISTGVITSTYPTEPIWSPDDTAYMAWSPPPAGAGDGSWALYKMDGTLVRMLPDPLMASPFWTPDSQQILLLPYRAQGSQIVALDLAGHEQMILSTNDSVGIWREYSSPISPSGKQLAFTTELPTNPVDDQERVVVYDFQGRQQAQFEGWGMLGWRPGQ